jgi:hypothetical protein
MQAAYRGATFKKVEGRGIESKITALFQRRGCPTEEGK